MKTFNFSEQFEFSGKLKTISIVAIAVGLAAIAFGLMTNTERTFANLLLMGYYFACVCTGATFFLAVQMVTQSGWSAGLLRIPQAMARTLPIAAGILIVICAAGLLTHNLYQSWNIDPHAAHHGGGHHAFSPSKSVFLSVPFFLTRMVFFLGIYSLFAMFFTKMSYKQDLEGGLTHHKRLFRNSAIFLVIFGFTSPIFAFDTIMSLEAHWFSTMFGWYNFAAMWVSSLCVVAIILITLRENGKFEWINENHIHDLGKFIFGFSIFWTYLWFSQFLLIYYANIPEETIYFFNRWKPEYKPWFWLNIVMNFVFPVLALMSRDSKRNPKYLRVVAIILLLGHWLDYYQMIMPGTVAEHRGFGIIEIGTAVAFVGLFIYFVFSALSKKPLGAKNHPLLDESLHHSI